MHRRAQAILTSLASEDHRFFIYSLNNLALSLWNQGKAEEAEQMMRRALATGTDLWGTDDWQIAMLYSNLGSMIQERELYEDSEDLLQRALKIRRRDLGDNHDNTAETMFHLAELSVRQGHLEEAERRYREAEAMLRGAHAGNDGHLAATLMRLATTLMSAERFEEAEQYARESLKINENYQPEYWGTYCVRSVLGAALMGQQKLDKALPLLLDGHVGMQQRWGLIPFFDRFLVRNSIERLVKYCETVGDGESLAHWQAELNSFDAVASQPTGALPDHSRSASRLR